MFLRRPSKTQLYLWKDRSSSPLLYVKQLSTIVQQINSVTNAEPCILVQSMMLRKYSQILLLQLAEGVTKMLLQPELLIRSKDNLQEMF